MGIKFDGIARSPIFDLTLHFQFGGHDVISRSAAAWQPFGSTQRPFPCPLTNWNFRHLRSVGCSAHLQALWQPSNLLGCQRACKLAATAGTVRPCCGLEDRIVEWKCCLQRSLFPIYTGQVDNNYESNRIEQALHSRYCLIAFFLQLNCWKLVTENIGNIRLADDGSFVSWPQTHWTSAKAIACCCCCWWWWCYDGNKRRYI